MKSLEQPVKSLDPDAALDLSKPTHHAEQSHGSLVSMILKAARSQGNKDVNDVASDSEKSMSEYSAVNIAENSANPEDGVNPDHGAEKEGIIVDLSLQTTKQALDNVDSPTTLSRKKLGFSGASAFAPVHSGGQTSGLIKPKSGPLSSASVVQVTHAQASAVVGATDNQCNKQTVEGSSENPQTDRETDSLPDQVKKLSEMFEEINRLVVLLEKASRSALQDIRRDK